MAYQVVGDGPTDLLYSFGLGSDIERFWDLPPFADFLTGLAALFRLMVFDRRGTGASDEVPHASNPSWEEWAEDIGAVLDAAGSERAALVATLDVGPMAVLYAASHPERVTALILHNTSARYMVDEDYPIGYSQEAVDALLEIFRTTWGSAEFVARINPSLAEDASLLDLAARSLRTSATPRSAVAQYSYLLQSLDVRSVLPLIQVPTLVLQADRPYLSVELGRYLADHIEGARFVELAGGDAYPGSASGTMVEEIAELVTGSKPVVGADRVLATVLFTDIVSSTQRASGLGDDKWGDLLDRHDAIVDAELSRHRGRKVHTTGDGVLATFDGPARAIRCALAIRDSVHHLGLQIRSGLHAGECELRGEDIGGIAVHTAARVCALAGPEEIFVSRTVVDLVAGSGLEFSDRGEHELKGVPGFWRLFAVRG